jgi:uncharacterized peroxidase-related enzyme
MAHIDLGNELPGISGLMRYRPETAKPLSELAEVLLRGPSSLPRGERELIAATVSRSNACMFCTNSHAAVAVAELGVPDLGEAPTSPKLAALLVIAEKVRESGSAVDGTHIAAARDAGATDTEIHDTVLIAAAFCMYNRYVDGLGTWAPADPADYLPRGAAIARDGYVAALSAPPARRPSA